MHSVSSSGAHTSGRPMHRGRRRPHHGILPQRSLSDRTGRTFWGGAQLSASYFCLAFQTSGDVLVVFVFLFALLPPRRRFGGGGVFYGEHCRRGDRVDARGRRVSRCTPSGGRSRRLLSVDGTLFSMYVLTAKSALWASLKRAASKI